MPAILGAFGLIYNKDHVEKDPSKGGLSKEAWIAAGATVAAAVIGGVVTLWTHLTPPAQSSSAPAATITAATGSTTTDAAPTPDATAATIRAMVGKWKGAAQDSNGTSFPISLEVTNNCAPGQLCGSISVPHVPCYGQIFLEKVDKGDVEFRVDNFDKRSNHRVCQPGAGEHFRLQSNGTLAYHTTYDPVSQGTLTRE
jgi:hypothetical protein